MLGRVAVDECPARPQGRAGACRGECPVDSPATPLLEGGITPDPGEVGSGHGLEATGAHHLLADLGNPQFHPVSTRQPRQLLPSAATSPTSSRPAFSSTRCEAAFSANVSAHAERPSSWAMPTSAVATSVARPRPHIPARQAGIDTALDVLMRQGLVARMPGDAPIPAVDEHRVDVRGLHRAQQASLGLPRPLPDEGIRRVVHRHV